MKKRQTNFLKRLMDMVLVLALVMSYVPLPVHAAASEPERFDIGNPYNNEDGTYFAANGTHLYINEGSTSECTVIYYMNGTQKIYMTKNQEAGEALNGAVIFGGKKDANTAYAGDTNITMYGGKIETIYGGSYQSIVTGNVNITVTGGTVGSIYATRDTTVTGNCNITITGGEFNIVSSAAKATSCHVKGNANLLVLGGKVEKVIGATGPQPVDGTVSGIVVTGTIYAGDLGESISQFDNLIYRSGTNWITKGSPMIPSGVTLTIPSGEVFTVEGEISNQGTIVNNGTMTLTKKINGGTFSNYGTLNIREAQNNLTIENHGTVNHQAVYVPDTNNIISLNVQKDNETINPNYYIYNNRLYIFTGAGSIMAEVNGTKYYGNYSGSNELELSKEFVPVTGIEGVPTKIYQQVPLLLPTTAAPDNMSVFNNVVWECISSNATIDGNKVTTSADAGTVKVKATVKNGLEYGVDFTKVYELTIQEGSVFDIANGNISIVGNSDGTAVVTQTFANGEKKETTVAASDLIVLTGTSDTYGITVSGSKLKLQLNNLTSKAITFEKDTQEVEFVVVGKNVPVIGMIPNAKLIFSGNGEISGIKHNAINVLNWWNGPGNVTFNGGYYSFTTYDGGLVYAGSGTMTVHGGTFRIEQTSSLPDPVITTSTLIITGGNGDFYTIEADRVLDGNGNPADYAEITLEGVGDAVPITGITGIEYNLTDVETINGKLFVYAADVEKITSITAGEKTYVGQLVQTGTKAIINGSIAKYEATFVEGTVMNITGVQGKNATYDGTAKNGFTGTISNDGGYTGEYQISYSGRNETTYASAEPPVNAGDYTVTISAFDAAKKLAGSVSLDFSIEPKALTDLSIQLSQETYVYDGMEKKPEVTVTDEDGKVYSTEEFPYDVTYSSNINAGQAMVNVTSKAGGNYSFELAKAFTVTKAVPEVTGVQLKNADAITNAMKAEDLVLTGNATIGESTPVEGIFSVETETLSYGDQTLAWKFTPNDSNYETVTGTISVNVKDIIAPTGEIIVKENHWKTFLNTITFGLFFNEELDVEVTASDEANGSGIASIEYYVTEEALTLEQMEGLAWMGYNGTFAISEDKQYVVYAKLTDNENNVTYLCSDGMVFDFVKPAVEGVVSGGTYYVSQKVAVSDQNLDTAAVNEQLQDSKEFTLAGDVDKTYVICVQDKAGNKTEVTVYMKSLGSLTSVIEDLTEDNVTADDKEELQEVLDVLTEIDTTDASEDEKEFVSEESQNISELLEVIEQVQEKLATDSIQRLDEITPETVKTNDKEAVEKALEDLEEILTESAGNLTEEEKAVAEDAKEDAKELLEEIQKNQEALEDALKAAEEITSDNYDIDSKDELETAEEKLQKIIDEDNKNYTDAEKEDAQEELDRVKELIDSIEAVEEVEKLASEIDDDSVKPDNKEVVENVVKLKQKLDAFNDKEKSLVGKDMVQLIEEFYKKAVNFQIIKGADGVYTKGSGKELAFTANGVFDFFELVKVDGEELDAKNYTAKAGSTVIELHDAYLNTLKTGNHTLEVVYEVAGQEHDAECSFTIKKALVTDDDTSNDDAISDKNSPDTGDHANVFGWMSLMLASVMAMVLVVDGKRRKVRR